MVVFPGRRAAALAFLLVGARAARAQAPGAAAPAAPPPAVSNVPPNVSPNTASAAPAPAPPASAFTGAAPADTGRPRAVAYSDAYGTCLAVHRYASYATLPVFAAE